MVVEAAQEMTRLRLPEPGLVLGIRYRGAAEQVGPTGLRESRLPDASLAGMTASARRMRTSTGGAVVLARFRPGGAAQFFAQPLHEVFGETVALDALVPPGEVSRLQERMMEAGGDAQRLALMQAFLAERLRPTEPDRLVSAAVKAISDAHGAVRVAELARRLATSQDPFEKRFRRVVGASPKQFASLVRALHALASYRPGISMATLAAEAGYFDESHLSRELRGFTGSAPGRFFRSGGILGHGQVDDGDGAVAGRLRGPPGPVGRAKPRGPLRRHLSGGDDLQLDHVPRAGSSPAGPL